MASTGVYFSKILGGQT